ncbi:hypothetical protein [Micromonospora maritima]|uniref:hypothetical protein n=1 Tax=Micromonospora maritima TaxID=986711 RepID=UPI00157C12A3|nr:hypothetical protein [Micromonospora maritima]
MTAVMHWHGFGPWQGGHEVFEMKNDALRRPREDWDTTTVPPLETGNYLLRRSQASRERTWTRVEDALDWLAGLHDQHPHDPTLNYPDKATRLKHTRDGLLGGADALWHYTTSISANRVVVYAVICCPHRHHTRTPCPLPPP